MSIFIPLRKIPLYEYEIIRKNFKELEDMLIAKSPLRGHVICLMASWSTELDAVKDGILILTNLGQNEELFDILPRLTCPYVYSWQHFYLTNSDIHGIFPSFKKLSVGCPIYAEDCGNARGTLGFFVKSRIGHGTYFITNAHVTNFLECIDCNTGKYIFQEVPQVLPSKKVLHPSETALEVKRAELARLRKNSWGIKRRYLNSRIKELDEAPKNVLGHVVFSFFGFRTDPIDERRRFADFSVVQISEDRVAAANKLVYDVSREETVTFSNNLSFSKLSYAGTPRNGRFDDQGLFTSVVLERSNNVSLDEDTKSTLVGLAGSNKIPSLSCQILAEENCCMTFFPGENRPVWSWALSSVCVATTGTFIAASDQGDSGSVLFDSFGKILGIVFGRTISSSGDPPLTLFMDIDIIRSLIDVTYEIA